MKILHLSIVFMTIWLVKLHGQSDLSVGKIFAGTNLSLYTGYQINFNDSVENVRHSIELGLIKTKYAYGSCVPGSMSLYFSNEIMLAKDFVWGPKFGGCVNVLLWVIGAELVGYTDFNQFMPRFIPYFGFGTRWGKMTVNPKIRLGKKSELINQGSFSLTINLFKFRNSKVQ